MTNRTSRPMLDRLRSEWYRRKTIRNWRLLTRSLHTLVDRGDHRLVEQILADARDATPPPADGDMTTVHAHDRADAALVYALRWGNREAMHRAVDEYRDAVMRHLAFIDRVGGGE